MEKIYEEDNKKGKKSVVDVTVVLSFVVAIFAIISLIAFGIDQTSYAAPVAEGSGSALDNGFKFIASGGVRGTASAGTFTVPLYYYNSAASNQHIFCVEHTATIDASGNADYVKSSEVITDYGLLYLLSNSFVNGVNVANGDEYVESWITQVAIWSYLYEKYPSNPKHDLNCDDEGDCTYDNVNVIKSVTNIQGKTTSLTGTLDGNGVSSIYKNYVEPLVDAAHDADDTLSNGYAVSLPASSTIKFEKVENQDYYQTNAISVTASPSAIFDHYDVSATGIQGATIIDANGNPLSTGVSPSIRQFYVRLAADKVTEEVQTLTINVKGYFNTLAGNYFVAADGSNLQKVVTVTGDQEDASAAISVDIKKAPDTGMNKVQTIYFIGLIVLLCGVGIVYANAKPVEVQQ